MTWKLYDKLYFFGPMSLGDSIVYNGIAHYFLEKSNEIHIPTVPAWYNTIYSLYEDFSDIIVFPMHSIHEEEAYININKLSRLDRIPIFGFLKDGKNCSPLWDVQIYHFLELPYSIRYKYFKLPTNLNQAEILYNSLVNDEYYVLTSSGRGDQPNGSTLFLEEIREKYHLPKDVQIINIDNLSTNMMDYIHLIKNANEIHCVPSAFYCLVENMNKQIKAKLFMHMNRANTLMNINNKWNNNKWNILEYATKL